LRKLHSKPTRAQIAPELLAKQQLDVGFVVYHKNEQAQLRSPDLAVDAA
jgi:hypothetical protein